MDVLIDEMFLRAYVPLRLPDARAEVISERLANRDFLRRVRRAIVWAAKAYEELRAVRWTVTR